MALEGYHGGGGGDDGERNLRPKVAGLSAPLMECQQRRKVEQLHGNRSPCSPPNSNHRVHWDREYLPYHPVMSDAVAAVQAEVMNQQLCTASNCK